MGIKNKYGDFSWTGDGFSSYEEAEKTVLEILQRIQPFFLDAPEQTRQVSKNLQTGVISAHVYITTSEGW